jgi:predicted RNA-binding protein with PUA-like domain
MQYWLFKSEPDTWSWDDQVAKGDAGQEWDGVRNFQARNNMVAMKKGDLGFFYHSGSAREIVGVVEVIAEAHPDSTADDARWKCVDLRAVAPFPSPVALDAIKSDARLSEMVLVKNSRLSVQPVRPEEWRVVCSEGGYTG